MGVGRRVRIALVAIGLTLALAALAAMTATTASADEATDLARRHYSAASAYFEEGRFDDAVREFRESYRLSHRSELLYNIGKSFLRKGDAARAEEYLGQYLAQNPRAMDRAEIQATIARLHQDTGTVRIAGAPDGAEVSIAGTPVGTAPLAQPVAATAGVRRVTARPTDGSAIRAIDVEVPRGGEVTAELPPPPEPVRVVEKVVQVPRAGPRWYASRVGWALTVTGVVVAVTGAVLLALVGPTADGAATARSEADWRDARDRADAFAIAGPSLLGAGAAVALGGVVAFAVHSRGGERVSLRVVPSANGLALAGAW